MYGYSLIGQGYCGDYTYLPDGKYPERLNAGKASYDSDPIKECLNRCLDSYGKNTGQGKIGNQGFYLRSSDSRCACAIGACTLTSSKKYLSYKISSGKH